MQVLNRVTELRLGYVPTEEPGKDEPQGLEVREYESRDDALGRGVDSVPLLELFVITGEPSVENVKRDV